MKQLKLNTIEVAAHPSTTRHSNSRAPLSSVKGSLNSKGDCSPKRFKMFEAAAATGEDSDRERERERVHSHSSQKSI